MFARHAANDKDASPAGAGHQTPAADHTPAADRTPVGDRTEDDVTIDEALSKIGTHRAQYLILLITTICAGYFAMQSAMPKVAEEPIAQKFPESKPKRTELVEACAQLVCQLLLLPLIDQFGRKKFLLIGTVCSVASSFLGTFAVGYVMFLIGRGVQVFFSALLPTVSYMYTIESMASKKRTLITVLQECVKVIYVLFLLGLKRLVEVWARGESVWKWLSPLACVPMLLPIGLLFFARESPRFLSVTAGRQKTGEALAHLCPGGETGLRACLHLQPKHEEASRAVETRENNAGQDAKGAIKEDAKEEGITIEIMREKKGPFKKVQMSYVNEWRVLKNPLTYAIGVAWVFQTCALWGLNTYMTAFPDFLGFPKVVTHMGTLLVQFGGQVVLWIIMLVVGRVWSIRVFAGVATLCHLILGFLLLGGVSHPGALSPFSFIAYAVSPPLWGPLIAYSNERYPTTLRSTALAILSATSSVCAIATVWFREFQMTRKEKWIVPLVLAALNVGVIVSSLLWKFDTTTFQLKDVEGQEPKEDPDTVEEKKKRLQSLRNIRAKLKFDKLTGKFKRKPKQDEDESKPKEPKNKPWSSPFKRFTRKGDAGTQAGETEEGKPAEGGDHTKVEVNQDGEKEAPEVAADAAVETPKRKFGHQLKRGKDKQEVVGGAEQI